MSDRGVSLFLGCLVNWLIDSALVYAGGIAADDFGGYVLDGTEP